MSVLSCSRGNCPAIMCDRYSHKYGYICLSCFDELVSLGADVNIEEFMRSDVKDGYDKLCTWAQWDEEFPLDR